MGNNRGLTLYRCCRGTNSLEGGIHQNVIRKFVSFGASPALADVVLADYRLRHNIDVGTMNRYGKIHKAYTLRAQLELPADYDEPGIHKHAVNLASSGESFGISTLPQDLMQEYGIQSVDCTSEREPQSSAELSSLIILQSSTAQSTAVQYKFIAKRQGAKHAVLPIHTQKEKENYDFLIRTDFIDAIKNNRLPDFEKFAKKWSTIVDGNSIFYKAPEHLRSYYSKWMEHQNIKQLDTLQQDLRSSSRKRTIPKAQVPLPLKIPRVDQTNNIQHQTSLPVTVTNHHNQEIPPAQHPSSASISRDLLQYQQLPYTMLPLTQTAPSSSTSMYGIRFDNLFDNLPKKRLRTCKQCGSNTCPGRTEEGDVNNKKIKI